MKKTAILKSIEHAEQMGWITVNKHSQKEALADSFVSFLEADEQADWEDDQVVQAMEVLDKKYPEQFRVFFEGISADQFKKDEE